MLLAIIVFISVFAIIALLLFAGSAGSADAKQTLAHLETALSTNTAVSRDASIDLRKDEHLSNIPWMNRWLQRMEIAPRLRMLLHQANVRWTVGVLLLVMAACFMIPGYLVHLRTGNAIFGIMIGLVCAYIPMGYVRFQRAKRFNAFEQGLPDALDLMVSALRAGHSLIAALRLVAQESPDPIGTEFRIC